MNTKLTTITTQYSKFSDNQVLTKGQLNQFLEYFEDQDHLSRISLSGVGIVCGFDVTYNNSRREIYITKGYGVTTDGDLLALVEPKKPIEGQVISQGFQLVQDAFKTYTHYRNFDDSNAKYAPFFSGEDQIELLEIFPEEDIDLTNTTYANLNTLSQAALDDKVVLLYLENYPKEGDLCTALDCDNQGIEQVARLRVLLVSSDDAKTITGYDPIYNQHDWYEYYLALPEIAVRRDILTYDKTNDYISLKETYYKLIKDNETLTDLKIGLDAILQKFGRNTISSSISSLFDISPSAVPTDFQYHYDVLKDLVDTYTEIKELLLHLNVHCCPSIGSFPKHLLLGRLKESQAHYKSLRHRFYKSPIVGHEDTNLKRVQSLLNKVYYIVDNYLKVEKGEDIKITPSTLQGALSHKTIPFYYQVTSKFLNHWSYNKFQNFIQTSNLSYHTTNLSPSLSVQRPLLYDLDNYNFLRIEGIQGKSYRDALDQVLILKEDYGLSFDVKALSINPTTKDIDLGEYRCEFEDLNVLLKAWTTEQECILASMASFFSGFTTDKVGGNIKEIEYTQGRKVIGREIISPDINPDVNPDKNTDIIKDKVIEIKTREDYIIDRQRILSADKQIRVAKQLSVPYAKNVIDESLTVEEKTIGRYMKEAIEENKEGSVNDIKNATKTKIEAFLSTDEWIAKPEVRDFIYNDVVDLLSVTYILSERIPQSIAEIDTGNIDTYELTLEEVCQLVKRLKVTYQTIDLEDTLKDILGLLINQLSFVCCSGEKLAILLDEIETRKQEILKQLQLSEFVKKHPGLRHYAGVPVGGTFVMAYLTEDAEDRSAYQPVRLELNFVEQPSVGDIIVDDTIIINDTIIDRPIYSDIIDKPIYGDIVDKTGDRAEAPINGNVGIIKLWDDRISTQFIFLNSIARENKIFRNKVVLIGETLEGTVSNLADFFNNIWRIAGLSNKCKATAKGTRLTIDILDQKIRKEENFIQFNDPRIIKTNKRVFFDENEIITRNLTTRNTVIADFALPYMCCSDCAPINFIVPKEPVSLSLPTPFICLDDSTTPIPFTVSPTDGEVKAIVEGDISDGVTQNEEGAYFFDATLLDPSLYGTAIRFTVNDEETIAVITVYENPQPIVTVVEEDFIYNDARTEVKVFFEVSGTGMNADSVFVWNFGDGSPVVQKRPNSDDIVSHTYILPIDPDNTVSPTLTVTNELCTSEATIDDITFQDPIEASLEIQNTYCLDTQGESTIRIPFSNISPEGGLIEIVGGDDDGMVIDQDTQSFVISPGVFSRFNEPIAFTISSLPTTAQITVFPIIQINIGEDPGRFFWDNGVLKRSYFFNTQLPDEVDADSLSYEWRINEMVESTEGIFEHAFTIIEQDVGNEFNVELFVTDTNGCVAIATTLVSIPFPSFSIALEEDTYCTDDEESYTINVSPNFPGTEIDGLGVTHNTNNTFSFIPIDTGITTSQSIDLRIVGTSEVATINLNSGPVPNFTIQITEDTLTLTNTSDAGAGPYVWNVGGEEIIRPTRTAVVLDIFSFEESVIDISLTVNGECGPNTLLRENITIRGDINFTLELPDGVLDYCNNDRNPYLITITPNIPGTIVEGDGVEQDENGNFVFIPFNSGVTSEGPVELTIGGDVLLTAQIHQPPIITIVQVPNPPITRPQTSQDITLTANPNIPGAIYNWTFGDGTTATGVSVTKTFTVPSGGEGEFSTSVILNVSGTICDLDPITGEVIITVINPNFTLELNGGNHDFCDNDVFPYPITVTPDISGTIVQGVGVRPDPSGNGRFVFRPNLAGLGQKNLAINGEVLLTANVFEAPEADFTFTPPNPSITRPSSSRAISFTASNANEIMQQFPDVVFSWKFVNPITGETIQERQGASTSVTFIVPEQAQGSYSITAVLSISGTLCDPEPRQRPVVIQINEEVDEPVNCNEVATMDIINDRNGLPVGDNIPSKIKTDVVDPTIRLYDVTIIPNIQDYLSGNKNTDLPTLFPALITTTANTIFEVNNSGEGGEFIVPISKYFIAQIKLFYHLLHCQEEFTGDSVEIIDSIVGSIEQALLTLSNMPFDVGDPDPNKPEGTLREFLIECFNDPKVSDVVKRRMDDLIALIIPLG